jgi:hypothetical protein
VADGWSANSGVLFARNRWREFDVPWREIEIEIRPLQDPKQVPDPSSKASREEHGLALLSAPESKSPADGSSSSTAIEANSCVVQCHSRISAIARVPLKLVGLGAFMPQRHRYYTTDKIYYVN